MCKPLSYGATKLPILYICTLFLTIPHSDQHPSIHPSIHRLPLIKRRVAGGAARVGEARPPSPQPAPSAYPSEHIGVLSSVSS